MKKLNYSWKAAGFALLFGLSMGLQSCDEVIDNPLNPVESPSAQPEVPATPTAAISYTAGNWDKPATITITNCADTKAVNTLLASNDSVKKIFTNAGTSIEIIVKGGVKLADAIAIPAVTKNPEVQITFTDAFTEAKKELAIANNAANANKFTVNLPESESAIGLNLTTGVGNTYLAGNAVLDSIKTSCGEEDTRPDLFIKRGVVINKYDYTKQKNIDIRLYDANAIKAVVLDGDYDVYKSGFNAYNVFEVDDEDGNNVRVANAIVPENGSLSVWPRSTQAKAGVITLQKNAKVSFDYGQDPENEKVWYTAAVESIIGADGSGTANAYFTDQKYDWDGDDVNEITFKKPVVGSFENVILPYATTIPAGAKNCTFTKRISIPKDVNSVEGHTFKGGVRIAVPAAERGTYTFTFNNSTFSTDAQYISVTADNFKGSEKYHVWEWLDKDGNLHYATADPKDEENFKETVADYDVEPGSYIEYKDYRIILSFQGCKRGVDALTSVNLDPIVGQASIGDNTLIKYQIGDETYNMSQNAHLVK